MSSARSRLAALHGVQHELALFAAYVGECLPEDATGKQFVECAIACLDSLRDRPETDSLAAAAGRNGALYDALRCSIPNLAYRALDSAIARDAIAYWQSITPEERVAACALPYEWPGRERRQEYGGSRCPAPVVMTPDRAISIAVGLGFRK